MLMVVLGILNLISGLAYDIAANDKPFSTHKWTIGFSIEFAVGIIILLSTGNELMKQR